MGLIAGVFKLPILFLKIILAICIFCIDHVIGILAGAVLGLGKGLSGLFNMGLRSFAVGLLKKT